jgi:tRNA A37 N6-isopentenylltransferase MiaA
MSIKISAIQSLVPNAQVVERADGIEWIDPPVSPVTDAEIDAEVAKLLAAYEALEYQRKRAVEYPDFRDYLDGVVKGDQAQIDKYIADCLAVKSKYPKI